MLAYRPATVGALADVLQYQQRQEVKEGYFASVLCSIARSLISGYDLPPYRDFLRQIDGKADHRTGTQIVDDLKNKLRRRRVRRIP